MAGLHPDRCNVKDNDETIITLELPWGQKAVVINSKSNSVKSGSYKVAEWGSSCS
jgi:hypothetical protein